MNALNDYYNDYGDQKPSIEVTLNMLFVTLQYIGVGLGLGLGF